MTIPEHLPPLVITESKRVAGYLQEHQLQAITDSTAAYDLAAAAGARNITEAVLPPHITICMPGHRRNPLRPDRPKDGSLAFYVRPKSLTTEAITDTLWTLLQSTPECNPDYPLLPAKAIGTGFYGALGGVMIDALPDSLPYADTTSKIGTGVLLGGAALTIGSALFGRLRQIYYRRRHPRPDASPQPYRIEAATAF
jgi:hypothetical protein